MILLNAIGIAVLIIIALFALISVHALCVIAADLHSDLEKELANMLYNFLNNQP